jgi:hypothetical protein
MHSMFWLIPVFNFDTGMNYSMWTLDDPVIVTSTVRPIPLPASTTVVGRGSTWTTTGDVAVHQPRRRWLVSPGSSPPTCRGRCGRCTPGRACGDPAGGGAPVGVLPGGVAVQVRGNKLFMP